MSLNTTKLKQRVNYDRVRLFFDRIDTLFPKFVGGQDRTKNNQTDSRDSGYTANTDSFIDAYADGEVTDDERKNQWTEVENFLW